MALARVADIEVPPPWTPDGHLRSQEWFTTLHARAPIALDEPSGIWQFYGYEAVREFLFHPENWSTAKRLEALPPELRVVRLLTSDPPQHLNLRSHFASAYRPKRIADLGERVRTVCRELLDACLEKGEFDLIADFAKPLTVIMISEIIGIPKEDHGLMAPMTKSVFLGRVDRSGANSLAAGLYGGGAQEGYDDILRYFNELIAKRRAQPQDDMISAVVQIPQDQMKDRLDLPALLFEQFGAGQNTTVHLIGSLLLMLDQHRDQYAKLRRDKALIASAVEETIRLHSPLQARPRVAMRDVEVDGAVIPAGSVGLGWLAGANIDAEKFDRALEFDIERTPNLHIGFGFGEHFCLGAHLARMEVRTAMDVWLEKVDDFERAEAGPPAWMDDFILHGVEQLRVRVKGTSRH